MHSILQSSLSISAGSLALAFAFASNPAQALTVQTTVNGITYDVTTFTGTYNENIAKFNTLDNNGLMPWWGSNPLANQFATQIWDTLGTPNFVDRGPAFSYGIINDPVSGSSLEGRSYKQLTNTVAFNPSTLDSSLTYAIATPVVSPPAAVPGPLPLFGAAAAFGLSRRLRRRIQLGG